MGDLAIRFIIGGVVVSIFAVIGDVFKPKTFAGLFGAAPSIALATLGLSMMQKGGQYGATEGRSMMLGAIGLMCYSLAAGLLVRKARWNALPAALTALPAWFIVAFGLWATALGGSQ